jgi:hypothetical protein
MFVGPVGIEPTTHGLKERCIHQSLSGGPTYLFTNPMFSRHF